jgi:spore coat protein U-like protein
MAPRALHALVAAGLVLAPLDPAYALLQSCSVSATAVNFGTYSPASGVADDATGVVTVSCQVLLVGLLESWTIDLSTGAAGKYTPRALYDGTQSLNYNLYTTSGMSAIWGNGSGGTSDVTDSRTLVVGNNSINYTVYGSIQTAQDKPPGAYADLVTVTVTY